MTKLKKLLLILLLLLMTLIHGKRKPEMITMQICDSVNHYC
jgi:hypothetical protein